MRQAYPQFDTYFVVLRKSKALPEKPSPRFASFQGNKWPNNRDRRAWGRESCLNRPAFTGPRRSICKGRLNNAQSLPQTKLKPCRTACLFTCVQYPFQERRRPGAKPEQTNLPLEATPGKLRFQEVPLRNHGKCPIVNIMQGAATIPLRCSEEANRTDGCLAEGSVLSARKEKQDGSDPLSETADKRNSCNQDALSGRPNDGCPE